MLTNAKQVTCDVLSLKVSIVSCITARHSQARVQARAQQGKCSTDVEVYFFVSAFCTRHTFKSARSEAASTYESTAFHRRQAASAYPLVEK